MAKIPKKLSKHAERKKRLAELRKGVRKPGRKGRGY
jgi:hypothetical protein